MSEQTGLRKLLVLHGPALESEGILGFVREHFDVHLAEDLDEALSALREGSFDAVLAETADFLPLERGVVSQQAAAILDTLGEGVCIVAPGGELVWANPRLREFLPSVLDPLRDVCVEAYHEFCSPSRQRLEGGRRFSLMPGDGKYYEVICSPLRDRQDQVRQVAAVVVDATRQLRQQQTLNAIDRAGRALAQLDRKTLSQRNAAQRLELLREQIIRCSRDVLDYQHFAVLLLDEKTNRLEMIVSEGICEAARRYEFFANVENNGICGYVAATGRSYVCRDVCEDPRYRQGMEGARSSLTVPLRLHDKVIGVVNVESDRVGAFGEEDRQFAEIFGHHVAMALHILELLVFERYTVRTQVSDSISAELDGPLNDVITEASELMEDYIGHDDLRARLTRIIDRASQARQTVQQWGKAPVRGSLAEPGSPQETDGVLGGKRVLVADDEEPIRQTVTKVLRRLGCEVVVACGGSEAIERIQAEPFDLVISDIRMPGATGYDVFAASKARRADCPVILMTAFGYDPNHSIMRANHAGLSAVLFKPFKVQQLLDECRAALAPSAP